MKTSFNFFDKDVKMINNIDKSETEYQITYTTIDDNIKTEIILLNGKFCFAF